MIQLNHVYKTFFKGKDTEVHALDLSLIHILMNGVDSLNVAVAAGLAMWELTQHRNQ